MKFHDKLIKLRKSKGISQEELAELQRKLLMVLYILLVCIFVAIIGAFSFTHMAHISIRICPWYILGKYRLIRCNPPTSIYTMIMLI